MINNSWRKKKEREREKKWVHLHNQCFDVARAGSCVPRPAVGQKGWGRRRPSSRAAARGRWEGPPVMVCPHRCWLGVGGGGGWLMPLPGGCSLSMVRTPWLGVSPEGVWRSVPMPQARAMVLLSPYMDSRHTTCAPQPSCVAPPPLPTRVGCTPRLYISF